MNDSSTIIRKNSVCPHDCPSACALEVEVPERDQGAEIGAMAQAVQVFKPLIDNRYSDDHIVSHSEMRIASKSEVSAERS